MKHKIGFIGAGNMAFALINAIKKADLASQIIASDVNAERLEQVKKEAKINITKDNKEVINKSDIIFIAVKPQVIDDVLEDIKETDKLIISIAAGIKIKTLEQKLKKARIVRVMPNTPCLISEMAAGFAVSKRCADKDLKIVETLLNSAGKALYLKEEMLDAVTGLSGSGPAFVARLIEAFIEAGIDNGLSKDAATELALQTFKGTAALLQQTKMTAEELVTMVSSPRGTTVAGREILESSDYNKIIKDTITKATERSIELGRK